MVSVLRAGDRIHHIPGFGVQTSQRAVASGAAAWWLAGGAPTPIAVYEPKGKADLATSYVNIVNPGTYDAFPGSAPTFDAATGWSFTSDHLKTGVIATSSAWSYLIRFSNAPASTEGTLLGAWTESGGRKITWLQPYPNSSGRQYRNGDGTATSILPGMTSGVIGMASTAGYINGTSDVTVATGNAPGLEFYIGAVNKDGTVDRWLSGKVQAVAIWNTSTDHATWMPACMAAVALI